MSKKSPMPRKFDIWHLKTHSPDTEKIYSTICGWHVFGNLRKCLTYLAISDNITQTDMHIDKKLIINR